MTAAAAPAPAIEVAGLVTRIGRQLLHDGLDLTVARGEIMGIVGGSGTGKSVLLASLVGLRIPAAGQITVLGETLWPESESGARRKRLRRLARRWGVLFQDGALLSSLTVAENVALPLTEHLTLPRPLRDDLVRTKIAMAGLPADAAGKLPGALSGGMRKRAGLARALALDPELLFLDEPTAGLDPVGAAAFDRLVADLSRSLGLTVLMVTHDLDSLHAVCDRVGVLVDRRLKLGRLADHVTDPHPWMQAYFNGPRGRAVLSARG